MAGARLRFVLLVRCVTAAAVVSAFTLASVSPSVAGTVVVSIGATFSPSSVTVAPGTVVTWRNDDASRHEIRSTSGPVEFRTDDLAPGQLGSVTFTVAGTYGYVDHRNHDDAAFTGTVVVTSAAPVPPPGGGGPPTPPPPTSATVRMAGERFTPASVALAVGGTVSWVNDDGRAHTVTAPGVFDSGLLPAGAQYRRQFTSVGTFSYYCQIHPDMRGTVVVGTAPGGGPPPPANNPGGTVPSPGSPGTSGPSGGSGGAPAGRATISVGDNTFTPAAITVGSGATITFVHRGAALHTATADDATFDSGPMSPGGSFRVTLERPGAYGYFCQLHSGMRGTITVTPERAGSGVIGDSDAGGGAGDSAGASSTPVGASAAAPPGTRTASVRVLDNRFDPNDLTVAPDTTVEWTLRGRAPHTVSAVDGSFDSKVLQAGATFRHAFGSVGRFEYECIIHPGMRGTVTVTRRATSAAPVSAGPHGETAAAASPGTALGVIAAGVLLAAVAFLLGGAAWFARVFRDEGSVPRRTV